MRIQPPNVTVDPLPVTADPPAVTVRPGSMTVTPPSITVTPPSVTIGGRTYTVPSIRVTPPPFQVTPPPFTFDPPPITVDPPPITFAPPVIEIDVPVGTDTFTVDPPPITVDPPPMTVELPTRRVTPPPLTVTPARMTITPPSFTIFGVRITPGSFDFTPPSFTVQPPSVEVAFAAMTVDPPPMTVDPGPFVVNLGSFDWGSPRFTTLAGGGPAWNRLNIAILGDGYTADQMEEYRRNVDELVDAFQTTEPLASYFRHLSFHRVDVISPEDGCDDFFAPTQGRPPILRRTALHTFYSPIAERRLVGPDPWVMQVARDSGAPWDEIIVLVNGSRWGGATSAAMVVAYVANISPSSSRTWQRVAIHEASHAMVKLFDEYGGELPDLDVDVPADWVRPSVLPWVNVDTNPQSPKWQDWLTPGVALPTQPGVPAGTVGAFEGGAWLDRHIFRPQENCLMRDDTQPFCVVCAEAWIRRIYLASRIADSFSPVYRFPAPPIPLRSGSSMTFRARVVRPTAIAVNWSVRDRLIGSWTESQRTQQYQDFRWRAPHPGVWQVRCQLEDSDARIRTPRIRQLARQEQIWNLFVG